MASRGSTLKVKAQIAAQRLVGTAFGDDAKKKYDYRNGGRNFYGRRSGPSRQYLKDMAAVRRFHDWEAGYGPR